MKTRIQSLVIEMKPHEYSVDIHRMQVTSYVNGVCIRSSPVLLDEDNFESLLSRWLREAEREVIEQKKKCDVMNWNMTEICKNLM